MTICTHCGAAQQDGAKFCTECGAPLTNGRAPSPAIMPRTEQYNRKKKPLYRRWWVWVIVIAVRDALLPAGDREQSIACDLNDDAWMDAVDASDGAVFFAAGVFYYFKTEDVRALFRNMARRFPGAVLVFDACNARGARMMTKTWLKEAGISDVGAWFSLEDASALADWSGDFASVTSRSYMRGYRDIYRDVGPFHRLMIRFCDSLVKMKIVKIVFKE